MLEVLSKQRQIGQHNQRESPDENCRFHLLLQSLQNVSRNQMYHGGHRETKPYETGHVQYVGS